MRMLIYSFGLLLLIVGSLDSAPAPIPREGAAEAVLGAPLDRDGRSIIRSQLQSLFHEVLRTERVRNLNCLRGERDPHTWLSKRLHVENDKAKKGVRVRLEGCTPREALTLLTAIVEAHSTKHTRERAERQLYVDRRKEVLVRFAALRNARGAGIEIDEMTNRLRDMEAMLSVPAVIQPPRLVSKGR
jgi:hypothetical protein